MTILVGDCRESLRTLDAGSVQTCVTSPPYYSLRDYGHDGQIGLEPTPDEYVQALVGVFREVRRVLRDDGTVWLNLGDSYSGAANSGGEQVGRVTSGPDRHGASFRNSGLSTKGGPGIKSKDLLGVPWMVAFALRADGWYLRSEIIWAKRNCMPESVTDRPTRAHEQIFVLTKNGRYFYDADAIREKAVVHGRPEGVIKPRGEYETLSGRNDGEQPRSTTRGFGADESGRNCRSVWTIATQPYAGAHFATFPPNLIEPCILAGSPPKCCGECGAPWQRVVERRRGDRTTATVPGRVAIGHIAIPRPRSSHPPGWRDMEPDEAVTTGWESTCVHLDPTGSSVVLDPFAGSGTTGVVCGWHGREFVGCELNPLYATMAERRIALEGRPGGRPNHKPTSVAAGQMGLL